MKETKHQSTHALLETDTVTNRAAQLSVSIHILRNVNTWTLYYLTPCFLNKTTVPCNHMYFRGIVPLALHRKLKRILLLLVWTRCKIQISFWKQNRFLGSAMLHHCLVYESLDEKVRVIQEQLHQAPRAAVETLPGVHWPCWGFCFALTALLWKEKLSAGSDYLHQISVKQSLYEGTQFIWN